MFRAIAVWAPGGNNTAGFSYGLAREFSRYTNVILVELPCLGIPRLGFVADIMDRENHAEAAITELEKKGELSFAYVHEKEGSLAVLPASVFAVPDFPLTRKVEVETLAAFPGHCIEKARRQGYGLVVFECQGQLTTPMTFFAVKNADFVLMPLNEPSEIAYGLVNIKRLIQIFKFDSAKFKTVSRENVETIAEVMVIKDEEGREISRIDALPESFPEIIGRLACGDDNFGTVLEKKKGEAKSNVLRQVLGGSIFGSDKKAAGMVPSKERENIYPPGEETWKIKL